MPNQRWKKAIRPARQFRNMTVTEVGAGFVFGVVLLLLRGWFAMMVNSRLYQIDVDGFCCCCLLGVWFSGFSAVDVVGIRCISSRVIAWRWRSRL